MAGVTTASEWCHRATSVHHSARVVPPATSVHHSARVAREYVAVATSGRCHEHPPAKPPRVGPPCRSGATVPEWGPQRPSGATGPRVFATAPEWRVSTSLWPHPGAVTNTHRSNPREWGHRARGVHHSARVVREYVAVATSRGCHEHPPAKPREWCHRARVVPPCRSGATVPRVFTTAPEWRVSTSLWPHPGAVTDTRRLRPRPPTGGRLLGEGAVEGDSVGVGDAGAAEEVEGGADGQVDATITSRMHAY